MKGKREPVAAFRLLRVGDAPERLHGGVFVGRERELDKISAAWARAQSEARCELVTVVGEAGVGKSRLVAEALALIDCHVVSGRCLPYGEGITYWPVVEVLKQLKALPSDLRPPRRSARCWAKVTRARAPRRSRGLSASC